MSKRIKRTLDWKQSTHLESNQKHRLMGLDCYSSNSTRMSIKRTQPLNLDQGREGACTGFGCAHALAASPKAQTNVTVALAQQLYYQARREDEWTGEAYDGSSVNGAMHAARTMGRIKSWRWARTPAEVLHGLSYHGAAEAGSPWLEGMWEPDIFGYLHATGQRSGGHAYCVSGFRPSSLMRGFGRVDYWIDNSWGPDWGHEGGAWITDDDAYSLWFDGDGEIAFPVKV